MSNIRQPDGAKKTDETEEIDIQSYDGEKNTKRKKTFTVVITLNYLCISAELKFYERLSSLASMV